MTKKQKTPLHLDCPCGAKAAVFRNGESKWFAHCPACGRMTFWANEQLTLRLEAGGKLCPHDPPVTLCKNGASSTSWCPKCRLRVFIPVTS